MRKAVKWALAFAAGCWMLGEGARMAAMFLFNSNQGWFYFPNTFDLFFDWVPLIVLGTYFLGSTILDYYKSARSRSQSH